MKQLFVFIRREIVLFISFILAIISMCLVHVDQTYISYIDFRTLAILFCLMVIMAGLQKLLVFQQIGEALINHASSVRSMGIILVGLCFFFSMLITNDVALLTFVPFTIVVLNLSKQNEKLISLIVLETVAANLGSMMMPMGNPQNLYLYSLTDLSLLQFAGLMLPYGALSLACILVLCFFLLGKEDVRLSQKEEYVRSKRDKGQLVVYMLLFVISLLVVARVVDYRIGFVVLLLTMLLMDRRMLLGIDYSLLFTFVFLFIFIGNMKRIPAVSDFLMSIVAEREIVVSVLASQVISNVPAAILLSGFTDNIKGLIVGTNLGGLGTLIASMASLISFKLYGYTKEANKGKYIGVFTIINVGMLLLLGVLAFLIK